MKKIILFSLILTSCLTTNRHKKNDELKSYGTVFNMPSCLASVKNHKTDSSLTFFLKQKSNKSSTILDEDYFLIPCDDVANFAAIEYNDKKIILYNELFFFMITKRCDRFFFVQILLPEQRTCVKFRCCGYSP